MQARQLLIEIYLEFWNDYLTVEKYAEHKGLQLDQAQRLIDLGRDVFNSKHPES